jgi:hypothetical protein
MAETPVMLRGLAAVRVWFWWKLCGDLELL